MSTEPTAPHQSAPGDSEGAATAEHFSQWCRTYDAAWSDAYAQVETVSGTAADRVAVASVLADLAAPILPKGTLDP